MRELIPSKITLDLLLALDSSEYFLSPTRGPSASAIGVRTTSMELMERTDESNSTRNFEQLL